MEIFLDVLKWSIAVGAAALALTFLKPLLDRRYSARWRYWAWLVMAALLLLAPVQWEALAPRAAAVLPETRPPVVIEVPRMEVSISREEGVALRRPAVSSSAPSPARRADLELDQLLPRIWLAGAALCALYRLLGTALFLRRTRRWSRRPGEGTKSIYGEVCREMGIRRPPALYISAAAGSPMLAGLARPRLLLPGEDWGERELRFILRHELTHYRRRDLWYKLALLGAGSLHWFNPLVHLLIREAEADLELTCDDLVMAGADMDDRRAYSETLLASLRREKGLLGRSSLSTHFYGGKEVMRSRFRNILGRRGRRWGGVALALALLVTLAAACTFGLRQEEEPPEANAPQEDVSAPGAPDGETARAEEMAQQIMEDDVQALGVEITDRSIDFLTGHGAWEVDGTAYSGWELGYRLTPADGEAVVRRGYAIAWRENGGESGWDWREGAGQPWEVDQGYTWEEYVVCYAAYGMNLPGFEGWPYRTEEFVSAFLDGHNTWALEPQDTSLEYLSQEHGVTAEGGLNTLYTFEGGTSLLLEADCGEGQTVRMLLRQESVEGSEAPIWQVSASQWTGEALLYTQRAELGGGVSGQLDLYGVRAQQGGNWGVSRVVWTPSGGSPSEFTIAEAVDLVRYDWDHEVATQTTSWTPDGGLTLEDVNFDGYLDIGLQASVTAYNLPYYYWFYNPDKGAFEFAFWLLGPMSVDAENRQLVCETHSGSTYYTEYYIYDPSGQLYLVRRDTQELGMDSRREYTETFDKPAYDWRCGSYAELTDQELASFADYFNTPEHNGLLRFPYQRENYLDLANYLLPLFYDHNGDFEEMTEAERAAVGPMELDGRKLTTAYIAEYLHDNYFLFSEETAQILANAGDRLGTYLPEYDAYYSQRGDTEMRTYTFDSGIRSSDGYVTLYYTTDIWSHEGGEDTILFEQFMCVNLYPLDGGWYVERNYVN